jgi:A/G-specific adenine glycosylase
MEAATARSRTRSKPSPLVSPAWKRSVQQRMLGWFAEHARDLPWRGTRDLYAIWLSEIMLQQTQVVTVIDYFNRFLARFPTVADLAATDEQDVLRLWEGLGYYRRARQLHKAAQHVVAVHGGAFPQTFDEVLALPGVGRYTAGAILSIGRDAQLPILEANTIRVLSRLLAYEGDVYATTGQQVLWRFAEELLPKREVGLFNQSLMELGATVCTPREPACLLCPLMSLCPTRQRGLQARIPAPKKKTRYEEITEVAVILRRRDGAMLVRQCQPGERWAGLWDFPRVAAETVDDVAAAVKSLTGLSTKLGAKLATLKHGVTRFRITLDVYEGRAMTKSITDTDDRRWLLPAELETLPLSVTGRKIARLIQAHASR